jgi:hypothetical protein
MNSESKSIRISKKSYTLVKQASQANGQSMRYLIDSAVQLLLTPSSDEVK